MNNFKVNQKTNLNASTESFLATQRTGQRVEGTRNRSNTSDALELFTHIK
jgi:hypothetical protein